jgi:hypothetical protein
MRTRTDLEGAFALLERVADDYATGAEAAHPAAVHDLVTRPPEPSRRRRNLLTGLSAAAVAAALAVGVTSLVHLTDGSGRSAGGAPDRIPLVYEVTVASTLGLMPSGVHAEAGFTQVAFTDGSGPARMIRTFPAGRQPAVDGLPEVTVNGRRGYYSAAGDPFAPAPARSGDLDEVTPGFPPLPAGIHAVVWEYATGRWAEIVLETGTPNRSQLLRVARAVRFTAPQPARSALRLRSRPAGLQLVSVDGAASDTPWKTRGMQVRTMLTYWSPDGRRGVYVQLSTEVLRASGGQPVEVDGRRGYWHVRRGAGTSQTELALDAGPAGTLHVVGARGHWTKKQLAAIARTITVTGHPNEPAQWFDARAALP